MSEPERITPEENPESEPAVLNVTDTTFEAEVLQADTPVLVDFWAPWCGPCNAFSPTLEKVAGEKQDQIKVVKVNIEDNPELADRYGIETVPALAVFKEGKVVDSHLGSMSQSALSSWIDQATAKPAEEGMDANAFKAAMDKKGHEAAKELANKVINGAGPYAKATLTGFSALQIAAGVALATASTATLPMVLGIGAAAYSAYNIYDRYTTPLPQAGEAPPPKSMLKKSFHLAGNLVTTGAGVALFGIAGMDAGFMMAASAGIAATCMSIKGLLGSAAHTASMIFHNASFGTKNAADGNTNDSENIYDENANDNEKPDTPKSQPPSMGL